MNKSSITATIWLMTIMLAPAIIFIGAAQSSYATGIATACFIGVVASFLLLPSLRVKFRHKHTRTVGITIAFFIVVIHSLASALANESFDWLRAIGSIALLLAEFACAGLFAVVLNCQKSKSLERQWLLTVAIFTILALLSIVVPAIGPWTIKEKPVPPFAEPSHYALSLSAMYIAACVFARRWSVAYLVACSLVMVSAVSSLTLLTVFALGFLCRANLLASICTGIFAIAIATIGLDLTYYVERLAISGDTDNISALVWLQGWEQAIGSIRTTGGIGMGFQQFGLSGETYGFADKILKLSGKYMNMTDGGTLASKLIGEFGYLGAGIVAAYIIIGWKSFFELRSLIHFRKTVRPQLIIAHSMILGLAIEMFVRSIGYFSVGTFFAMAGGILLARERAFTKSVNAKCLPTVAVNS